MVMVLLGDFAGYSLFSEGLVEFVEFGQRNNNPFNDFNLFESSNCLVNFLVCHLHYKRNAPTIKINWRSSKKYYAHNEDMIMALTSFRSLRFLHVLPEVLFYSGSVHGNLPMIDSQGIMRAFEFCGWGLVGIGSDAFFPSFCFGAAVLQGVLIFRKEEGLWSPSVWQTTASKSIWDRQRGLWRLFWVWRGNWERYQDLSVLVDFQQRLCSLRNDSWTVCQVLRNRWDVSVLFSSFFRK